MIWLHSISNVLQVLESLNNHSSAWIQHHLEPNETSELHCVPLSHCFVAFSSRRSNSDVPAISEECSGFEMKRRFCCGVGCGSSAVCVHLVITGVECAVVLAGASQWTLGLFRHCASFWKKVARLSVGCHRWKCTHSLWTLTVSVAKGQSFWRNSFTRSVVMSAKQSPRKGTPLRQTRTRMSTPVDSSTPGPSVREEETPERPLSPTLLIRDDEKKQLTVLNQR